MTASMEQRTETLLFTQAEQLTPPSPTDNQSVACDSARQHQRRRPQHHGQLTPCTIAQNWYVEFARTTATRVTMFCHHGWTKRCSPGDLVRRGGTARSPERVKFQAAVSDTVAPV